MKNRKKFAQRVTDKMTDREKVITKSMPKYKLARLARDIQKLYNKMCRPCQIKYFQNPRRPVSDYCSRCQDMIKQVYEKYKQ